MCNEYDCTMWRVCVTLKTLNLFSKRIAIAKESVELWLLKYQFMLQLIIHSLFSWFYSCSFIEWKQWIKLYKFSISFLMPHRFKFRVRYDTFIGTQFYYDESIFVEIEVWSHLCKLIIMSLFNVIRSWNQEKLHHLFLSWQSTVPFFLRNLLLTVQHNKQFVSEKYRIQNRQYANKTIFGHDKRKHAVRQENRGTEEENGVYLLRKKNLKRLKLRHWELRVKSANDNSCCSTRYVVYVFRIAF